MGISSVVSRAFYTQPASSHTGQSALDPNELFMGIKLLGDIKTSQKVLNHLIVQVPI